MCYLCLHMCYSCFTDGLLVFYRCVTRVLQMCYSCLTNVLLVFYRCVTHVYKCVTRVLQMCYSCLRNVFYMYHQWLLEINYSCFTDLSVGCLLVLTDIIWKVTITWYAGNIGCKMVKFAQCVATYGATYSLVALSIDRFDAIARPMNMGNAGNFACVYFVML